MIGGPPLTISYSDLEFLGGCILFVSLAVWIMVILFSEKDK